MDPVVSKNRVTHGRLGTQKKVTHRKEGVQTFEVAHGRLGDQQARVTHGRQGTEKIG